MTADAVHKYRILQELGQGGAAKVYLAVARGPQGFNKLVVLKAPKPEADGKLVASKAFLEEARLAARLNHPNVVETYEVFELQGVPVIVMQYLEGQSLAAVNARGRDRVGLTPYLHVFCDVLAGLHHSHELRGYDGKPLNVVHRDVSPQNIFITYDGQVKVLDFGIAKLVGISDETQTGIIKGKIAYMAPEQVLCSPVDRRTDLFAVGVMLWEAAAGERMYAGLSEAAVLHRLAMGDIHKPSDVRPIEPELERIIMKACAPDMDERYATGLDMHADLEALIATPRSQIQRRLSQIVSEMFQEEREARAQTIERALSRATPQAGSAASGPVDFGDLPNDFTGTGSHPTTLDSLASGHASASGQVATSLSHTGTAQHQGASPGRRRLLLVAGLALVGAVLGWGLIKSTSVETPTTPSLAPASVAAPRPSLRKLRIVSVPDGAVISLDGQRIGVSPYIGEHPADSASHTLLLELPGHEPLSESVRLDADVDLRRDLTAIAAPSAKAEPANAEAAPARRTPRGGAPKPRPAAADKPAQPTSEKVSCSPPYFFDAQGVRHFKPECL